MLIFKQASNYLTEINIKRIFLILKILTFLQNPCRYIRSALHMSFENQFSNVMIQFVSTAITHVEEPSTNGMMSVDKVILYAF